MGDDKKEIYSIGSLYIISLNKNEQGNIINIKRKTENYELLEIIKVVEFDVTKEDYDLEEKEIFFDDKIIENKIYTDLLLKEDLLSILLREYDCFDNIEMLNIENITNDILK